MKLDFCCICGKREGLHHHHIIPREHGGSDDETNLITLCYEHHAWIHSLKPTTWNNHSKLVLRGLEEARKNGRIGGRPTNLNEQTKGVVIDMRSKGIGLKKIAKKNRVGVSTLRKFLSAEQSKKG